jgi:hypothetical protein
MLIAVDHRAGPLKKSDLKYRYSDAAERVDPMQLDEPDAAYLNRQEWYQVLYFVNMFANVYGKGSTGVARHAEKLLHEHLPRDLRSHDKITQWLLNYWKFHS